MKNYKDSDYAINKYSEAIVYRFANGNLNFITLEKYLEENPHHTKKDFEYFKNVSDENYYEQVCSDHNQTKKNVPIHLLDETSECSTDALEDDIFRDTDKEEGERLNVVKAVLACITKTQKTRYLLHVCKGMTTREIADIEGVSQNAVFCSLRAIEKKKNKILQNYLSKRSKKDNR